MRRLGLVVGLLILLGSQVGAQQFNFRWGGYGLFRATYHPDSGSHFTARTWTMTMDLYIAAKIRGFGTMDMLRWNEQPLEEEDVLLTAPALGLMPSPIKEMWLSWEYLTGQKVRMGLIALPLGGNQQMQIDFYWPFPHRPMWGTEEMLVLPTSLPWSEPGLDFNGALLAGNLIYDFGMFQGPRLVWYQPLMGSMPWVYNFAGWDADYLRDNNRDKAFAGKLAYQGIPGLVLGVSGYSGVYTPEDFNNSGRFTALDVQGKYERGLFKIMGEYVRARYNNLDAVVQEFANRYMDTYGQPQAMASVAHLFDHASGYFVDLTLRLPQNPKFFVAARYEGVRRYGYLRQIVKHQDGTVETTAHDCTNSRLTVSLGYRPSYHSELFVAVDTNKFAYLVWGLGF